MRRQAFRLVLFTLVFMCCTVAPAAASILVKEGSSGEAVRHVQELLIEQGFLEGEADGDCGPLTVAAIKKFQQSRGLTEDGVCGDGTYYYLSDGKTYEGAADEEERPRKRRRPPIMKQQLSLVGGRCMFPLPVTALMTPAIASTPPAAHWCVMA